MNNLIKEKGKKGHVTYKCKNKYIYSYYDPVNEAKKYLTSFKKINKYVITCCGEDYVNSQLLLFNKDIELIISFEPIKFIETEFSNKIIRSDTTEKIEKILLEKNIHAKDITLIIWQPLIESFPDIYLNQLKLLKDILYKASISSNTANKYGFLEFKNLLINLLNNNQICIIKSNNKKINNPAIILSSGPSLKDNINFINKVKNKSYIFALPSSLPFIEHKNIIPDFIIAVDPGYATLLHLSKFKRNVFLMAHLGINPSIFNIKNLTPIIFSYNSFLEKMLFEDIDIVTSSSEGSVFINLLRILPQLGFEEVILIGQDFGYKDHRSHINEGSFEKEFISSSNYFITLENSLKKFEEIGEKTVLKIKNKEIITTIPLKIYYEHFINNKFSINILLPENTFNPISDAFNEINYDYIIRKYPDKKEILSNLIFDNISKLNYRKKNIFNYMRKFSNDVLKSKEINQLVNIENKIYFDINNKFHIYKILKFSKALSSKIYSL